VVKGKGTARSNVESRSGKKIQGLSLVGENGCPMSAEAGRKGHKKEHPSPVGWKAKSTARRANTRTYGVWGVIQRKELLKRKAKPSSLPGRGGLKKQLGGCKGKIAG